MAGGLDVAIRWMVGYYYQDGSAAYRGLFGGYRDLDGGFLTELTGLTE